MAEKDLRQKKVLITCGPTWVPIDEMRVISNRSTGELGQRLAAGLAKSGARVTVLEGPVLQPLTVPGVRVIKYFFYDDLSRLLRLELKKKYDAVIHAAAVSDYRLKKVFPAKLSSGRRELTLTLVPTEKLITAIKKIAPRVFLVGFKLEAARNSRGWAARAVDLIRAAGCDLVVVNSIKNGYQADIIISEKKILQHCRSKRELSGHLIRILKESL